MIINERIAVYLSANGMRNFIQPITESFSSTIRMVMQGWIRRNSHSSKTFLTIPRRCRRWKNSTMSIQAKTRRRSDNTSNNSFTPVLPNKLSCRKTDGKQYPAQILPDQRVLSAVS